MKKSVEGSIYKTPDGKRWYARVQYSVGGERRQKKRTCLTQSQAKAMIAELKNEVELLLNPTEKEWTYRELDAIFRKEYLHEAKIVGGVKISGYRQKLNDIENYLNSGLSFFGDLKLNTITLKHIIEYKNEIQNRKTRKGNPRSASGINHHLRIVRRLLNVAVEKDMMTRNPFTGKRGIFISNETERIRILGHDEEIKLLNACEDPHRHHLKHILVVAVETALRSGELKKLKWSDVNFEQKTIRVISKNSKTLRERLVPVSDRAAIALRELRRNNPFASVVNVDTKRSFNTAKRIANISDLRFHDLRHTAITR